MAKSNRVKTLGGILWHSFQSSETFAEYLQSKGFSTRPSVARWGLTGISATILLSILAIEIGLLATLAIYYSGGGELTTFAWVLIGLATFFGVVLAFGAWVILRLGTYWLDHQYIPRTDRLVIGFVKGASDTGDVPTEELDDRIEEFGVEVGKYAKTMFKRKQPRRVRQSNRQVK
jgi:hypothetical protein